MMAIHDIMKLAPLLPTVAKNNAGDFRGYAPGEKVQDHDVALSYVLAYHPELLPSYKGLPAEQQESVRFSHCKMEYNMGWLVQAEAPPGALFKKFREVILSGQAKDNDIAFYFVHWFVDLAGAEPWPMEGCDKFVLRFPQRVLMQFLQSFGVVQDIYAKSETHVNEEYLKDSWTKQVPPLGDPPFGPGSIARMRLVLMAQGDSVEILRQFQSLPAEDQRVLRLEMACTGCENQQYACDSLHNQPTCGAGPAILVYYGPALLQKAGKKDPKSALIILAEVYRRTRELWPLSQASAGKSVVVRIDALKELECSAVLQSQPGQIWVVAKTSGKDAMVKLLGASDYKGLDWESNVVLTFVRRRSDKRTVGNIRGTRVSEIMPKVRRFSLFGGASGSVTK